VKAVGWFVAAVAITALCIVGLVALGELLNSIGSGI
jgi:hypothetical protein